METFTKVGKKDTGGGVFADEYVNDFYGETIFVTPPHFGDDKHFVAWVEDAPEEMAFGYTAIEALQAFADGRIINEAELAEHAVHPATAITAKSVLAAALLANVGDDEQAAIDRYHEDDDDDRR